MIVLQIIMDTRGSANVLQTQRSNIDDQRTSKDPVAPAKSNIVRVPEHVPHHDDIDHPESTLLMTEDDPARILHGWQDGVERVEPPISACLEGMSIMYGWNDLSFGGTRVSS